MVMKFIKKKYISGHCIVRLLSLSWMTLPQESKQRGDERDILAEKIGGTLGKDR